MNTTITCRLTVPLPNWGRGGKERCKHWRWKSGQSLMPSPGRRLTGLSSPWRSQLVAARPRGRKLEDKGLRQWSGSDPIWRAWVSASAKRSLISAFRPFSARAGEGVWSISDSYSSNQNVWLNSLIHGGPDSIFCWWLEVTSSFSLDPVMKFPSLYGNTV